MSMEKMQTTKKPSKNISDVRRLVLKQHVQNAFESRQDLNKVGVNPNFKFTQIPKRTLNAFLGKIRNHDIVSMATFALVNEMTSDTIQLILQTINEQKGNTLKKDTFSKLENKIKQLQQRVNAFKESHKKWCEENDQQQDIEIRNTSAAPQPPNLVAFQMHWSEGAFCNISGELVKQQTPESSIKHINRQMQLAGYKENRCTPSNNIFIPLAAVEQLGSINIRMDDGFDTWTVVTLTLEEDGYVKVNHK